MTSLIDIIIRATWAGGTATQQAKRDLGAIDDGARKGGRGLQDFATKAAAASVAIGAVTIASKAAFDALERGAGLELTRQRFDRLAESIGTTGDALREGISGATGGLLSDAQQMALATDLIALGLATTEDEVVRLSRGVAELNQDLGELSLALVNQTTRRFDQLGVSAVGFKEKLDDLKEQGLDTQAAFTEAFLQQMEEQLDRVGGRAGTAAGELDELKASINNVKDAAAEALLDVVRFAGGFDDISEATEALDELAEKIEKIGDNFDNILLISQAVRTIQDPFGNFTEFYDSVIGLQKEWFAEIENTLTESEKYQNILDGVVDVLEEIEQLTGIELIGNMEAAVEEAESFDRALMNANNTLTEIIANAGRLSDALPDRGGIERGEGAGGRSGEIIRQEFGTIQERVTLFQDFQDDLTAINKAAQAERASIEEDYEARRTAIVENYGRRRAEEEQDWNRRRARAEQDFRDSLDDVRERAAESEADARAQVQERLENLERDHLKRMRDIIDNASQQLSEAASRLDARAVARILRQRDAALKKEQENYTDQQKEIKESLDKQLADIRDNMNKRLADLQEFHDKRLEREEEDRAIRLQKLEEAHRRELDEAEKQYRERMQDLKAAVKRERQERQRQYTEDYNQLTQHWSDRQTLEAQWQETILRQEEEWWRQRSQLVGGGSSRGESGGTTGGTGGGTDGTGQAAPSRAELESMLKGLALDAGYSEEFIRNLLRSVQSWSDERLAKYMERVFGIDIPGYRIGTPFVPRDQLAFLHKGERVTPAAENRVFNQRQAEVTLNVYPSPGMNEAEYARLTRRELLNVLEGL